MTATLTRVPLRSSLEAASQARSVIREVLDGHGQDLLDRGCILVDELVASALQTAGAPVELLLDRRDDRLVVEVVDGAAASFEGVALRLSMARSMLDAWAEEWGATPVPGGTSVWFVLDLRTPA